MNFASPLLAEANARAGGKNEGLQNLHLMKGLASSVFKILPLVKIQGEGKYQQLTQPE